MQTFLPYPDFDKSAEVLDSKRLVKQLLEGRQLYQIISENRTKGGWVNHPATKMWRNYDNALFDYLLSIKIECDTRGFKTATNWQVIVSMHDANWNRGSNIVLPPWWNDDRLHLSHRQSLYRKDPEYYALFIDDARLPKVTCCDVCNNFWPTHTLAYNDELIKPFEYIKG